MTSHKGQTKKIEGAPKVLCSKYGAILTIISGVTIFWKNIFLWSAAILKVSVEPNRFSNLTGLRTLTSGQKQNVSPSYGDT